MTIRESFEKFHQENPHVYQELVSLARLAKSKGRTRFSINMLFEVIRWNRFIQTNDPSYKLNNSLRSHYARLIMMQEKDLDGLFEIRNLTA
jgi:hypothetical protein